MKKFLFNGFVFACLIAVLFMVTIVLRISSYKGEVESTMHLQPWQKIVFVGDSHIGCTFVEDEKYENYVLWESSMPQQFTLMRLRDMEKRGVLADVEMLILDFGLQSIGQQRTRRMKEFWWRMIPITIYHNDILPLSLIDKAAQFCRHPRGRIHIKEEMPEANISILSRSQKEREDDFQKMAEAHFEWINNEQDMCANWEQSLKCAIDEIYDICNRNSIQIVFITAPLTSYYVRAIPDNVNAKLREFTDYIKAKGIPYYDLRDWGEDDDFRDSFHFRLDGAKKFTEWFFAEIVPKHRKYKAR